MADVSAIRAGIKTRLATITALANRSHTFWPDNIVCPAALVKPIDMAYHQTMGSSGQTTLDFEVVLAVLPVSLGIARGQEMLDAYLDDTGASSVKAAIEGDKTLGGTCTTLTVKGWSDYGTLAIGGLEYIGVRFNIEVWP